MLFNVVTAPMFHPIQPVAEVIWEVRILAETKAASALYRDLTHKNGAWVEEFDNCSVLYFDELDNFAGQAVHFYFCDWGQFEWVLLLGLKWHERIGLNRQWHCLELPRLFYLIFFQFFEFWKKLFSFAGWCTGSFKWRGGVGVRNSMWISWLDFDISIWLFMV